MDIFAKVRVEEYQENRQRQDKEQREAKMSEEDPGRVARADFNVAWTWGLASG